MESTPDNSWRRIAPLLAARRSMRLYDVTQRGFASSRPLTTKRPAVPAAVPLFSRGRARVIALDFDAKHHGHDAVIEDVNHVLGWLEECGGRTVVDVSSSGGRHVLVPLAPGKTVSVDELRPLLNQLAARLPTLDITPMTNAATGCITVPGSQCREGGYRKLVDDLASVVDTLTVGSEPAMLTRLETLLGGYSTHQVGARGVKAKIHASTVSERVIGAGGDARLHPRFCRASSNPSAAVTTFAASGELDTARWLSRSEARQSVIAHAVLAGATAADIADRARTPEWAGVKAAYAHYRNPEHALRRDALRALDWAASTLPEPVRDTGHKKKHTGGTHSPIVRNWLQTATRWVTREYGSRRDRWTTHVVIQALAWASAVAGQVVEGVPVVGVGGRSLSIAAGMLPESTVWSVLERLRETEGSPLLLIERGVGQNPDRYALVVPRGVGVPESAAKKSSLETEIESVHPAWSVVGWRHKALYDAVAASSELLTAEELFERVSIGRSSGYETLLDLKVVGLIASVENKLMLGPIDLDTIGHRNGLTAAVRARIVRHRAERIIWREWLAAREEARTPVEPPLRLFGIVEDASHPPAEAYHVAVMDSGPPD